MSWASIAAKGLPPGPKPVVVAAPAQAPPPKSSEPVVRMVYGGDLFSAPANSILIHACNTLGSWSSGVAAAFLERYPGAHQVYVSTCNSLRGGEALVGTALLIPPQEGDVDAVRRHWVACLFTSVAYGKKADPPEKILRYTKDAVEDLWRQVEALEKEGGHAPGQWHSAKINSARFKVPWQDTANVIEDVLAGKGRQVVVYEYDERAALQGGGGRGERGGRGGGRGGRGRGRER